VDGGFQAYCEVTVTAIPITVPVTGIQLDQSSLTVDMNQMTSFLLTPTVLPSNASNKAVSWTSDDPGVVTVSAENGLGRVTLVNTGTTRVRATTEDGGFQAYCEVTVLGVTGGVTGVTLNRSSLTGQAGDPVGVPLIATVLPEDAPDKRMRWSSTDYGVAYADDDGVVFYLGVGTAVITVTTEVGGKTADCQVTVNPLIMPTAISLDREALTARVGDPEVTLHATLLPSNANPTVVWTSFTPTVASVSSDGTITFVRAGQAIIRAQASVNRNLFVDCLVTVE
jgi:uncharacterized protein YjdB